MFSSLDKDSSVDLLQNFTRVHGKSLLMCWSDTPPASLEFSMYLMMAYKTSSSVATLRSSS